MNYLDLNGFWDFAATAAATDTPVYDKVLPVPGCFDANPEYYGKHLFGWYRRKVTCGGQKKFVVGSAGLHYTVFWDGKEIGSSAQPWSKEEFLFDAGPEGEHEVIFRADNMVCHSDPGEQYKEYYDFYGYGGVYGYLRIEEIREIDRIDVLPVDYRTGEVEIRVIPSGKAPAALSLSFDGKAPEQRPFAEKFRCVVPDFKVWSPDSPNLHAVKINDCTATFGIRTLEWKGRKLLLNGKPLKLIGYCRHESHPEFGAAVPPALTAADLLMLKQQGCNFIRGSHYPQLDSMLELCDRMGILVWEETMGWNNRPEHFQSAVFRERQERAADLLLRKSINHPSVIIWGFLNECCSEQLISRDLIGKLVEKFHTEDFSRPVTFACSRVERCICRDLVDINAFNVYPGWYDDIVTEDGIPLINPRLEALEKFYNDKPLILSEIGAGAFLGDHSGARWSEDYQAELVETVVKKVLTDDNYTGVALWQFSNCNTYIIGRLATSRPRGMNNKGLLTEYRQRKMAWNSVTKLLKGVKLF